MLGSSEDVAAFEYLRQLEKAVKIPDYPSFLNTVMVVLLDISRLSYQTQEAITETEEFKAVVARINDMKEKPKKPGFWRTLWSYITNTEAK